MSAIAGVFSRRGAPRRPGEIDEMLAVMATRGPDGTSTWSGDRITLGHGALHATPESVGEQMPLVDHLTGNVIVADVRLDNRQELIQQLGLDDRHPSEIGDGHLLVHAYRNWGEDCVDHILGDFAFAVWDERRQQLFLARDHFGAKPLTYHSSEHLFAFASDSRSVVDLADVPAAINRHRVFDFLIEETEWVDTTSTFFQQVDRLPPAHTMTISSIDRRLRRYWHLPEPTMLRLNSDAEYEEASREVLDLAVSCRLRGRNDVGVTLSGGIDSASIAATALDHGPVHAYSAISTDDHCVETELIRKTASMLPVTWRPVDRSSVREVCGDFEAGRQCRESPFTNGALMRAVFCTAERDGRRSMLTGVLADEVVAISAATAVQTFLASGQHRDALWLALSDGNFRSRHGRLGLIRSTVSGALARNRLFGGVRAPSRQRQWSKWKRETVDGLHLRLTPAERLALERRLDTTPWTARPDDTSGSLRQRVFDAGYAAAAMERYDRSAAASSIESRSPFMDRRVVEFFQRLPAPQLVSGGWTKSILRRSMVGRLPCQVVWTRHKQHLGWSFTTEWLNANPEDFLRDLRSTHPVHDYVDVGQMIDPEFFDPASLGRHLRVISLAMWLDGRSTEGRPPSPADRVALPSVRSH